MNGTCKTLLGNSGVTTVRQISTTESIKKTTTTTTTTTSTTTKTTTTTTTTTTTNTTTTTTTSTSTNTSTTTTSTTITTKTTKTTTTTIPTNTTTTTSTTTTTNTTTTTTTSIRTSTTSTTTTTSATTSTTTSTFSTSTTTIIPPITSTKTTTTSTTSTRSATTITTTTSSFKTTTINKTYLYYASNNVNSQWIDTPTIQNCGNIEKATINGIQYNLVIDQLVGVYLYDTNWVYKSTFFMPNISFGIVANNFYYFSLDYYERYGIIKTSLTSSTIIKSFGYSGYHGLYYDSAASRIIAAGCYHNRVDTFNLNLKRLNSYSFRRQCPLVVTVYNSKIYVILGWTANKLAVIDGSTQIQYVLTQLSYDFVGISVDEFGYFALSCYDFNVYIYDSNLTYTNKLIGFDVVRDARLDTNNRLAICGGSNVAIYDELLTTVTTTTNPASMLILILLLIIDYL